jgi:hypothetical protein
MTEVLGRTPRMGVKTGANQLFFFDRVELDGDRALVFPEKIAIPVDSLCRALRGRDVRRWQHDGGTWMLWSRSGKWNGNEGWLERLAVARGASSRDFQLSFVAPEHLGLKVAWKDVSRGMQSVVVSESVRVEEREVPLVPNQTLYFVDVPTTDEAFLIAGILNSTIGNACATELADRAKDSHFRYFAQTVAAIPFPRFDGGDVADEIIRLSRAAHRCGVTPSQLDAAVAELYRIPRKALRALEEFIARRIG